MADAATKFCPHCATRHPATNFARNPARSDGLASWCKPCSAEAGRKRRLTPEGREAYASAKRRYRARLKAEREASAPAKS